MQQLPGATPHPDATADRQGEAAAMLSNDAAVSFRVADRVLSYRVQGDGFAIDDRCDAPTVVALAAEAWSDVVGQVRTLISLLLSGDLTFQAGDFDTLADWDPALKLLHAGIPVYQPGRAALDGIALARSFTLDDDLEDMRSYLNTTGYLLIKGAFSADEMAAANAEVDRLAAEAREDDGTSWYATTADGSSELCRLIYATQRSEVLRQLAEDARLDAIGTLISPEHRRVTDRMDGFSVLIKVPGKTDGLSNIPWHQDCGMGGHGIMCPALLIGIQLTGSSAATGNFAVVPGSHGQSLHYLWEGRLDGVPTVEIDTEPGDITVHIQDLMHASPEPTGPGGRRTAYIGFSPPSLFDAVPAGQAFNDVIRDRTHDASALVEKHT